MKENKETFVSSTSLPQSCAMYTINHSDAVEMIELMRLTEIPLSSLSAKKQFKIDLKKIKLDKLPMRSWFLIIMLNNGCIRIILMLLPTNKIIQRSTRWEWSTTSSILLSGHKYYVFALKPLKLHYYKKCIIKREWDTVVFSL